MQVFFQITGGDEDALGVREEQRRSPPNDLLPRFDVTYPAQAPRVASGASTSGSPSR